jgi:hypothetical protein
LAATKLVTAADVERVRLIEAFGLCIANTDMHLQNLSFFWQLGAKTCALAPVYDMLPMYFSPTAGGEVPADAPTRPVPRADLVACWDQARGLAAAFWSRVAADKDVSAGFRGICAEVLAAH